MKNYNILIFGTGSFAEKSEVVLAKNVNVIAYVDNDLSKQGTYYRGKQIISPDLIRSLNYNYILIASQWNEEIYNQLLSMGINDNKILQFFKYHNIISFINLFNKYLNNFINNANSIQALVTGISYANSGIIENLLSKKTQKFTLNGQDLFYDYKIVEYILNRYKRNKIQYVIIGLSYYCFQYDLSLSRKKYRVGIYYDLLKDSHNYDYVNSIDKILYEDCKGKSNNIIDKNKRMDSKWDYERLSDLDMEDRIRIGEIQATTDCNKNYPETVRENTSILKKYLQLLKGKNIKPILVVFPASKYYVRCFSRRIENEYNSIINELNKIYDFQYIDYF